MSAHSSRRRGVFRAASAGYSWLLSQLLVISVAILVVPVTLQIISRYTDLIPSYIWTEELARFMFVWSVMIGAMLGIRESSHFEVDVWTKLTPRQDAALRLLSRVFVLVVAFVFIFAGIEFTRFAWNRTSELADMPLWWIHVAWPVAGFTWLMFLGEQMYDDVMFLAGRARRGAPDPGAGQAEAQSGGHE